MEQLSLELINSQPELFKELEVGPVQDMPEKVIQFGEGNFLRAFADSKINDLNKAGLFNGKIVVVQPIKVGIAHLLNEQDGMYTLMLRGYQDGKLEESKEVITSISRGMSPYEDYSDFLKCARNPELRFMFSNTTEAGIAYVEEPKPENKTPDSFPAKAAAFLFERFQTFDGSPEKGMVIICCELIENNASNLKKIILKHAENWKLGQDFVKWLRESCHFLNSLVDRIVPGYPRENATEIESELGYRDKLIDTGEIFHLWVIEGPEEIAKELPFDKVGLNVVWTDDMTPYRTRKVRMLNGAHTSSVLGAYLSGLNTVGEMLDDDVYSDFLKKTLMDEILPYVDGDLESNRKFAMSVLERFRNPYIKHELLSISLNSVSKWKVRVMPSLLDYLKDKKVLPPRLTFSLAALIAFYQGVGCAAPELRGDRNGKKYSIKDDVDILAFFESRWYSFAKNHDIRVLVGTVLANESLWGRDLTLVPGMIDMVSAHLQNILVNGSAEAAKNL